MANSLIKHALRGLIALEAAAIPLLGWSLFGPQKPVIVTQDGRNPLNEPPGPPERTRSAPSPRDLTGIIAKVSGKTNVPESFLTRLVFAESSNRVDAQAETSSACGLTQQTENALYENVYKYGVRHGFAEAARLVQRVTVRIDDKDRPVFGYKPVDDAARATINTLCLTDPHFAIAMGGEHVAREIKRLTATRDFVTAANAYTAYVLGHKATVSILKAADKGRLHYNAGEIAGAAAVKANPGLFTVGGQPASIGQFLEKIKVKVGDEPLTPG